MSKKSICNIIQKLKSKHTSLKKYTNWAKLIYFLLVLREREEKYFAPKIETTENTWVDNDSLLFPEYHMSGFFYTFWISLLSIQEWQLELSQHFGILLNYLFSKHFTMISRSFHDHFTIILIQCNVSLLTKGIFCSYTDRKNVTEFF